jgi:NDP-sugar pyrophosphorylase family protein
MSLPPLAILAGGSATRLQPITRTIPKSLVPVAGEPFVAHQIRLARRRGFERIVLLTGHLGNQVKAFVGDGAQFGVHVEYCDDGPEPLGTGGAVRNALAKLGSLFFVIYGDSYLDVPIEPLLEVHKSSGCPVVMTVFHNRDRWDPSNVIFDGSKVLAHDKAASGHAGVEWIDYGLTLFESGVFQNVVSDRAFDLAAITSRLAKTGQVAGVEVAERFYEIGKPDGLAETEIYIRSCALKRPT